MEMNAISYKGTGGESMYPNLRAEMARRIMITQISSHLKLRHATVSDKINGKFRFIMMKLLKLRKLFSRT